MSVTDITLERWDALSDTEKESLARALGRELPDAFRFAGLEPHALGGVARTVAFFTCGELKLALVPGGEQPLGWERRPIALTDEQRESWKGTQEEYGVDLERFFDEMMSPRRSVVLAPFLIGVQPTILAVTPIETLEDEGFAMPTEDEWEHACRAGSRTLFRWGDVCPGTCYPIDASDFDLHLRRNAFGLSIGHDPYDWELCDGGAPRGGDGGGLICGGAGFFAGWLPLASAFKDPNVKAWEASERTRRVLRLR